MTEEEKNTYIKENKVNKIFNNYTMIMISEKI